MMTPAGKLSGSDAHRHFVSSGKGLLFGYGILRASCRKLRQDNANPLEASIFFHSSHIKG